MPFGTPVAQAFPFADGGGAGKLLTFSAGPPAVGAHDILFVNSDTTVATPAGFTVAPSNVGNQGAYVFRRKAASGETDNITVTTSGNFNCSVIWVRLPGANLADQASMVGDNGIAGGTSSPAFTSASLSESGEIAFAFAALHGYNNANPPTDPNWSAGYTPLANNALGSGPSGTCGLVAYKTPAGPAAESPSVSWTNGVSDRYLLFISFTADAAAASQQGIWGVSR